MVINNVGLDELKCAFAPKRIGVRQAEPPDLLRRVSDVNMSLAVRKYFRMWYVCVWERK